jgi:predicted nuclease of predicted toxin-antitoxin system
VKFLVDAQLPIRLARSIFSRGHDVIHTSELPNGNRTTDAEIARIADDNDRVVVTKDRDFRDSHLLSSSPRRLLIVATGNISNDKLLQLFDQHHDAIVAALEEVRFVELGADQLIIHQDRPK